MGLPQFNDEDMISRSDPVFIMAKIIYGSLFFSIGCAYKDDMILLK